MTRHTERSLSRETSAHISLHVCRHTLDGQPYFDMCRGPEFRDASERVGDDAGDFHELRSRTINRLSIASILREPMRELPQVLYVWFES
jgi:hypothetical protein